MPVQYVIRPISDRFADFRGYAGRVAGGVLRMGDRVRVLPSGLESTVKAIGMAQTPMNEAYAPSSITIELTDDIDISRGDLLVRADEPQPQVEREVVVDVCWFNERPLLPRSKYVVRQATAETMGMVSAINHRRNINTLELETNVGELRMNDIAEITLRTANPLVFDRYADNRTTGSLIFIDPDTNETVGAGMIK